MVKHAVVCSAVLEQDHQLSVDFLDALSVLSTAQWFCINSPD